MAYMRDAAGRRLDSIEPARDLPKVMMHLDASALTGANDSPISAWDDESGLGHFVHQMTASKQPLLKTNAQAGKNAVYFGATSYLEKPDYGSGLGDTGTYSQPNTFFLVVKFNAASNSSNRSLWSGTATGNARNNCWLDGTTQAGYLYAGTAWPDGGKPLDDGQWHVIAAVFGTTHGAFYVDGYLVTTQGTQAHGTEPLGAFTLGASGTGTLTVNGAEYGEFIHCNASVPPEQILATSKALAAKWGITITAPDRQIPATYISTTDSAGINIRVWPSPKPKASGNTLVIWNHQHSGTEAITSSFFMYPLIHAAINEGYIFAASRLHGDNWGNNDALTDLTNLYNYVNSRWPVSNVVLIGGSMGGLATALAIPYAAVPNIKACIGIDAVFDLAAMHASASYTTSVRTAYGVASDGSDYSTKTAGHDPMLRPAADFGTVPWRFYGSDTDTTVPPATHMDLFKAKINATAEESVTIRHAEGHLAPPGARSQDVIEFIRRSIA